MICQNIAVDIKPSSKIDKDQKWKQKTNIVALKVNISNVFMLYIKMKIMIATISIYYQN